MGKKCFSVSYRSLLESLQQLLLDGVVQLSGDQSFLLQTDTTIRLNTVKTPPTLPSEERASVANVRLTSFLFSLFSTFLLRGTSFLLKDSQTINFIKTETAESALLLRLVSFFAVDSLTRANQQITINTQITPRLPADGVQRYRFKLSSLKQCLFHCYPIKSDVHIYILLMVSDVTK